MATMKYRVGDEVTVRSGRDKGRSGKISAVLPKKGKVIIDGINVRKRHRKQSTSTPQAGVYEESMPVDISKIGISHPHHKGKADKIAYTIDSKGLKKRIYSSNGKEIKS